MVSRRLSVLSAALLLLAACGGGGAVERAQVGTYPDETPELRAMAEAAAARNGVPPDLVRRVVSIESGHRPEAVNGTHVGLMQIDPQTARTLGYRGDRAGLFDAATNLEYGTRYLRGAWIVANGDSGQAYDWYRREVLLRGQTQGSPRGDGIEVRVCCAGRAARSDERTGETAGEFYGGPSTAPRTPLGRARIAAV